MASTSTAALSSAYGTIDVNSLVSQLMQVERNPETLLKNRQLKINSKAAALESLATDVNAIKNAAAQINAANEWEPLKTTSSSSVVTTSATSGAITGGLSFKINRLATNQKLYSSSTVTSTSSSVTSANRVLLAAGMGSMGFSKLTGDSNLALGQHTVVVTQASAAAKKTGGSLSGATIVAGVNDTLDVTVGGQAYTLNLADGTYSGPQQVADAVNSAISALGGGAPGLKASVADGKLVLTTTNEGSAASIQVTGGSALTDLGLATDGAAITGTDGKLTVDGTETVLTNLGAGTVVGLSAPTGSISATLAGGLRSGTATVANVDTGGGSLSSVVNAINSAGVGVAAAAVKVGDNAYRLQIESRATGTAGRLNVDLSAFDGVTGFANLAAGTDAEIEVQGSDPYTVTSASNTFTDVLPGVSFTLNGSTNDVVTISASRDSDTLASRISTMVDMINQTFADIKVKTAYNASSTSQGALIGDSTVARLKSQLTAAVTDLVAASGVKQANAAGLSLNKDGSLKFDKVAFQSAYAANPTAVQRLFVSPDGDADKGITQRLADVAVKAVDSVSGYLTTSAANQRSSADRIGKQVDAFEKRMTIREAAMKAQYNALNVALERLSQQNTSLMSQLSGLNSSSSSDSSS